VNLTGGNLISGVFLAGEGKAFSASNPLTGETLAPLFHEATFDQVGAAAEAARAAFQTYRRISGAKRAEFLEAIAAQLEGTGETLIDRCGQETGLPAARLKGELARTTGQLRQFAGMIRDGSWADARIDPALPARQPAPRPDLRRMLIPLGPVAVFGASNFPLAFSTAGGDTASALAAGCPVLFKAHPAHPGTCELVAQLIAQAAAKCGIDAGVFALLHGGREVGMNLVRHPAVTAVGFTGSRHAGRAIFDAAAARPVPIPVMAEMSSVNPLLVLPDALQTQEASIAQGLAASVMLGSGQFCTKPGVVLLPQGPATDSFLSRLDGWFEAAAKLPMLTVGIHSAFISGRARVTGLRGVTARGNPPAPTAGGETGVRPNYAVTDAAEFCREPALAEEVFGPFTLVVKYASNDELEQCLQRFEGQLTATLHATEADWPQVAQLLPTLEQMAGRLILNGFPTGVEVAPAMTHGGPYPSTTDPRFTSVGTAAIFRFARPVSYQNFPERLLPPALRNGNPEGLLRMVEGRPVRDSAAGTAP
jgi:NADP-dependent aldehyde dehydrogenase